jgi:hypothetical protein
VATAVAEKSPRPAEPEAPVTFDLEAWRGFVRRWLESESCAVGAAARGDWEVELPDGLQRRWRRKRMRLVFDPLRPTLPRGAWFAAPGSGAGRRILEAATEVPIVTRRTALACVPGAPDDGFASVCRVRGLTWSPPRLGPVRYERRLSFHALVTRWGGLPSQEPWVLMMDEQGRLLEWARESDIPGVRVREGLYQINDEPASEQRVEWVSTARRHLDGLLEDQERAWEAELARSRDDELQRLGDFFSSRIEEEEERLRRRSPNGDEAELERGDATSLKLEWERRAAEVRQRWELKTEVRLWGVCEWSWPVARLEQELRTGAVHLKLEASVDVARGRPGQPPCPSCHQPAELLVRSHGSVACEHCG